MKRIIIIAMIILLLGSVCGCGRGSDVHIPVNFYYCTDPVDYNSIHGVISPEIREGDGYVNDLKALLDLYLQGPVTDGFRSPFPDHISVESIKEDGSIITFSLGDDLSQLIGHDLTLAGVCLSMTVFDLTEYDTIRIATPGGSVYMEVGRDDLLFLDGYTEKEEK